MVYGLQTTLRNGIWVVHIVVILPVVHLILVPSTKVALPPPDN